MNVIATSRKAAKTAKLYFALFGVHGLIKRALISVSKKHSEFKALIPHTAKRIIVRLGTTDVAAFEHVFVNEEYGFSLAQPPSIIVDAGANVGMSAAYFALRYPTARIFAVEPELSNFKILKKNAQLFPQIIPINAALWNREGSVQVLDNGGGHWGMRAVEARAPTEMCVRATTLRTLMHEFKIEKIDLLKVDVEGAECEIFEDASQWIDDVGVICAELHDRFRPGCSAVYGAATTNFSLKWRRGELHCAARDSLIARQ